LARAAEEQFEIERPARRKIYRKLRQQTAD
jgi:hypothetical protein